MSVTETKEFFITFLLNGTFYYWIKDIDDYSLPSNNKVVVIVVDMVMTASSLAFHQVVETDVPAEGAGCTVIRTVLLVQG